MSDWFLFYDGTHCVYFMRARSMFCKTNRLYSVYDNYTQTYPKNLITGTH